MEAETTVDSILKEIDMEMPENKKYLLPLQDIGNETMDMIVDYNTQNNATSKWKEVPHQSDLVPDQYGFDNDDEEEADEKQGLLKSDNNNLTADEAEKVTISARNMTLPPSSSKSNLIDNLKEEVGLEMQRINHEEEQSGDDDTHTLNFSVKATEPLIGNSESADNLIEVSTVLSDSGLNLADDNSDHEDQELLSRAKKPVSPARIPITNAHAINNFSKGTVNFHEEADDFKDDVSDTSMKTGNKDTLGSVPDLSFSSTKHSPYKNNNIYDALQSVENLEIRDVESSSSEDEQDREDVLVKTTITDNNTAEYTHEFKTISSYTTNISDNLDMKTSIHEDLNDTEVISNKSNESSNDRPSNKCPEQSTSYTDTSVNNLSQPMITDSNTVKGHNESKQLLNNIETFESEHVAHSEYDENDLENASQSSGLLQSLEKANIILEDLEPIISTSENTSTNNNNPSIIDSESDISDIKLESHSITESVPGSADLEKQSTVNINENDDGVDKDGSFAKEMKDLLDKSSKYESDSDNNDAVSSSLNNESNIVAEQHVQLKDKEQLRYIETTNSHKKVSELDNSGLEESEHANIIPVDIQNKVDDARNLDESLLKDESDKLKTVESEPQQEILVNTTSNLAKIDSVNNSNNSRLSSTSSSGQNENSSRIWSSSSNNFTPVLPPLPKMEKLTINEFHDDLDTSSESIDVFSSVKPTDYLSIWHLQKDKTTKALSPAISANSQFTYHSASTKTSSPSPIINPAPFTFKPKVVSRSKYYYSGNSNIQYDETEEFIYKKLPSLLDPMRRNTSTSKKIREKLATQRKFQANTTKKDTVIQKLEKVEEPPQTNPKNILRNKEEKNRVSVYSNAESATTTESQMFVTPSGTISDLNILQSNVSIDEDFENILDYMDKHVDIKHEDDSNQQPKIANYKRSEKLWNEGLDLSENEGSSTMKPTLMETLLKTDSTELEECQVEEERVPDINLGLGILRSSVKDISTGTVDATVANGRDISISKSVASNNYGNDNNIAPGTTMVNIPSTPKLSPIKNTHVDSPFKVIRSPKKSNEEAINVSNNLEDHKTDSITDEAAKISIANVAQAVDKEKSDTSIQGARMDEEIMVAETPAKKLTDEGILYLQLTGTTKLSLSSISHHKPKFSFEFDNGINTARTSWQELPSSGIISIDKEFELPIINKENSKYIITLKIQYTRIANEIVEVTRKVPMGKKFPFGKMKYKTETKFVERATNKDEWDYLFARDGSFGRCEINVDENILKKCQFSEESLQFDLINKWSRLANNVSSKMDPTSLYELPRRPPYGIGKLNIKACYFQRLSNLEKFPSTMKKAHEIVKKYRHQQDIKMEGFLLQEGGDVKSQMKNRYFKLHGNELIGYHEVTMKPKIHINLLKVVKIVGKDDIVTNRDAVRNFTAWVLMNDCFQLVFDDGEVITFSAESSHEEKQQWYAKLKEVTELNAFHQPWVKRFSDNLIYSDL